MLANISQLESLQSAHGHVTPVSEMTVFNMELPVQRYFDKQLRDIFVIASITKEKLQDEINRYGDDPVATKLLESLNKIWELYR